MPASSDLKLTLPAENSLIASMDLSDTVPFLGLGIKPLGPKILATLASALIKDGSATAKSKFALPLDSISLTNSSPPALAAPAALALSIFSEETKAQIDKVLPNFLGKITLPLRTCPVFLSKFRLICASMVSLNLALAFVLTKA